MDNAKKYLEEVQSHLSEKRSLEDKRDMIANELINASLPFIDQSATHPIVKKGLKFGVKRLNKAIQDYKFRPEEVSHVGDIKETSFPDLYRKQKEVSHTKEDPDIGAREGDLVGEDMLPEGAGSLSNPIPVNTRLSLEDAEKLTLPTDDTSEDLLKSSSKIKDMTSDDLLKTLGTKAEKGVKSSVADSIGDALSGSSDALEEATLDSLAEDEDPLGLLVTGTLGALSLFGGVAEAKSHIPKIAQPSQQIGISE